MCEYAVYDEIGSQIEVLIHNVLEVHSMFYYEARTLDIRPVQIFRINECTKLSMKK